MSLGACLNVSCDVLKDLRAVSTAISQHYPALSVTVTRHSVWSLEVTLINSPLASEGDSARRVTSRHIAQLAYSVDSDSVELREIVVHFQSRATTGPVSLTTEQARYVFYASDFRPPAVTATDR